MKRILVCLAAAVMVFAAVGCSLETKNETVPENKEEENMNDNALTAVIEVEGYGKIELELYPDVAPETVRNFCYLARKGFYNGTTFHRIIKGFMIQGGDPTGTGSGGPGYCIKGEFDINGFSNELKHTRGVISMARLSRPYDSAGCQFFIMHADAPHLDGAYAAFGRVTSGIEVVDAIAGVAVDRSGRPYEEVVISSITVSGPELPEPEKLPDIR